MINNNAYKSFLYTVTLFSLKFSGEIFSSHSVISNFFHHVIMIVSFSKSYVTVFVLCFCSMSEQ